VQISIKNAETNKNDGKIKSPQASFFSKGNSPPIGRLPPLKKGGLGWGVKSEVVLLIIFHSIFKPKNK
jgi:hypothetical protein